MEKPLRLSTAYANWVQGDNHWNIFDTDGNVLGMFPQYFSEREMMQIIRLGREFELEAFNRGIEFGKGEYKRMFDPETRFLKGQVSTLEKMNITLSDKLEKFIIGESEEEG